jgi:hypothetical protein
MKCAASKTSNITAAVSATARVEISAFPGLRMSIGECGAGRFCDCASHTQDFPSFDFPMIVKTIRRPAFNTG